MSASKALAERRAEALEGVEKGLSGNPNFRRLELDEDALLVWETTVEAGRRSWLTQLFLGSEFPDEPPGVLVPEATELMLRHAHVLREGMLCTIPESWGIDSDNPLGLIGESLSATQQILEKPNPEDFQEEFLYYWSRVVTSPGVSWVVLDPPESFEETFLVACSKGRFYLSSSESSLVRWVANRFGKDSVSSIYHAGIRVDLEAPLTPERYPRTIEDLLALAAHQESARRLLSALFVDENLSFVLLRQRTPTGYALAAVASRSPKAQVSSSEAGRGQREVTSPKLSKEASINRGLKAEVDRFAVSRADHGWIHARGLNQGDYLGCSVLLLGCGSLGGYVAHLLSRAGVERMTVVDKDVLHYGNLGRHILGAKSVGKKKAEALASSLSSQMPHLNIRGIAKDWRKALEDEDDLLSQADLVVSTMGDWRSEAPLNYLACRRLTAPVLYGWLEPYALAGHCLVSVWKSGCLACGSDYVGRFEDRVADFGESTLTREPGGCTEYQQYGPIALQPVAALIAQTVLECLAEPPVTSRLETWVGDEEHFAAMKAELHGPWPDRIAKRGYRRIYSHPWPARSGCRECA